MGRLTFDAFDSLQEWDMRTPDPNDHFWNRAEANPDGRPPRKDTEPVSVETLNRRVREVRELIRADKDSGNRGRRSAAPDLSLPTVPRRGGC